MRELKFRVWSEEDKEYRTDLNVFRLHDGKVICTSPAYSLEGDRFDIEQYTGLKDKSGKEIYEGDIIDDGNHICRIEWSELYTAFEAFNDYEGYESNVWFEAKYGKVIGNIHENPELLGDTNVTNKEEE